MKLTQKDRDKIWHGFHMKLNLNMDSVIKVVTNSILWKIVGKGKEVERIQRLADTCSDNGKVIMCGSLLSFLQLVIKHGLYWQISSSFYFVLSLPQSAPSGLGSFPSRVIQTCISRLSYLRIALLLLWDYHPPLTFITDWQQEEVSEKLPGSRQPPAYTYWITPVLLSINEQDQSIKQ